MRGIVLAGGTGSRLLPATATVNKHCLEVAGSLMISYPLQVLRDNDIHDVTIVSSPSGVAQLSQLLGQGFEYKVQQYPTGVAGALLCAERPKCDEHVAVVLGDNVFYPPPKLVGPGPKCYLYRAKNLSQLGVARFEGSKIDWVFEKLDAPPSEYAVIGLYLLPASCFERIKSLTPSARGELEITDLLNTYAVQGNLHHEVLSGFWSDAGTFEGIKECESLLQASTVS